MSNENVTPDDDDVAVNVEIDDKNDPDKNKSRRNFWPFGKGGDKRAKSDENQEKSDRKKSKSLEVSCDKEKVIATAARRSKRRATLEPSASPSVSTTTPRPTRYRFSIQLFSD